MADPRLEQERILPRLQRLLDVVSSWADRPPGARAPNVPDMDHAPAAEAAVTTASADSDGDADRAHGSATGAGRRHVRATEPIWHMITGQDARVPPGLATGAARPAAGASVAMIGVDGVSDEAGASPSAARDAAAPARDAAVLQPLLGQETPPLFGRATAPGRAATASDTGPGAPPAPAGADAASAGDLAAGHAAGQSAGHAAGDGVDR
jgi:hypothetical protein